jgi:inner membrane protein
VERPSIFKIITMLGVIAALILGLGLIQSIVSERSEQRNVAIRSVGSAQTLMGPFIHKDCVESWNENVITDGKVVLRARRRDFKLTALPNELKVQNRADIGQRTRSIYPVNVFTLHSSIHANWANLDSLQPQRSVDNSRLSCGAANITVAVTDSSGIRLANLKLNNVEQPLKPGALHEDHASGVHSPLPASLVDKAQAISADFELELLGTQKLSVVPLGGTTQVSLTSNWPHPSFSGNFLPSEREITEKSFKANWNISSLATTVAANMNKKGHHLDSIDVEFIEPVNAYSLSHRATKYGLLFIALTFVAVGLFELMQNLRVHPVQYFLVGSAICSFFLLLVSLSEHIGFNMAYASAAAACVLLLTFYASHMLGSLKRGLPLGSAIALLYGLLFLLLQLEQKALVVGAIALFMVLTLVMTLTRKVNWYQLGNH